MITCPFCHKHVHLSADERDTNTLLDDQDTDDFYCPTFVDVSEGKRWCHYWRKTAQGSFPEYWAVIPPFYISWSTDGKLEVQQFHIERSGHSYHGTTHIGGDLEIFSTFLQKENTNFEDFIQMYHRFKILRAFT